jgi:hypothetical protein
VTAPPSSVPSPYSPARDLLVEDSDEDEDDLRARRRGRAGRGDDGGGAADLQGAESEAVAVRFLRTSQNALQFVCTLFSPSSSPPAVSRILLPTKVPNVHGDVGDGAPYFDPSAEGWIRVTAVRRSGEGDADDRTQSEARERQAKRLTKIAGGGA